MADADGTDDETPVAVRVALLGLLLVAAAALFGGLLLLRTVAPTVTEDAEAARLRAQRLLPMALPAGFRPAATLDWNMLYLIPMEGVWIEGEAGGVVTLLSLGGRVSEDETLRQRAADSLREQVRGSADVEDSTPLEVVIRGRAETLELLTLRDRATGERSKAFSRAFATADGPVFLEWRQPEAAFDADAVRRAMISIP